MPLMNTPDGGYDFVALSEPNLLTFKENMLDFLVEFLLNFSKTANTDAALVAAVFAVFEPEETQL